MFQKLSYRIKSCSERKKRQFSYTGGINISTVKGRRQKSATYDVDKERKKLKKKEYRKMTYYTKCTGFFYSKKKQEINEIARERGHN